jgi:glycosyltransferase involved in cell wall biosynthesis
LRVAIVHYWLVGMRGGERVLEQIVRLFPQADIFTHVLRRDRISESLLQHRITCTDISRLPFAATQYKKYLMFMPRALEELDLSGYDLVISSESGPAKGVIAAPGSKHITYCHSPMRYIWDQYHQYKSELGWPARKVFERVAHQLRQWDVTTAARVDKFVANSQFVAKRIARYYGRDSEVLNPPVDLERYRPLAGPSGAYYFLISELVPYKRADIAIEAFRGLDRQLVVAGGGSEFNKLRASAPPNVRFTGRISNEELRDLYANCRALLFPGEEDFGIVPLEAMACGRPVLAYGAGGVLETVVENQTGLFFRAQTAVALKQTVLDFEANEARFDASIIRAHAETFSEEKFRAGFQNVVERTLEQRNR